MDEPVPVIPLEYGSPDRGYATHCASNRVYLVVAAAASSIGAALIVLVTVESVLATGPVLLLSGVLLMVGGIRCADYTAVIIGSAHVAICMLFFGLVLWFHWGPGRATQPFAWMS